MLVGERMGSDSMLDGETSTHYHGENLRNKLHLSLLRQRWRILVVHSGMKGG